MGLDITKKVTGLTYNGNEFPIEATRDTTIEDAIINRTISQYTNDRITTVGNYAFYYCSKLRSVSFPACTTISGYAFYACNLLTSMNFLACTSIGNQAFRTCSRIATMSFPVCASIGTSTFDSCYNLLSLYLLGSSVPTLANINAFNNTPISNNTTSTGGVLGSIIVKSSMLNAFKTATNWSIYSSRFSVWNEVD